ncbi:hypothetical protein [Halopseudomonas salina]|uniref:Uncharacterized protein n=1 Tax=Halopseudomonas salina TaxID=1323744 RepID=A0ABQ1Q1V9_9GAMM|nr:hypothetical protein [Halopseudomonas salina]GGD09143.1 hypothetical protein GCM10007418_30270 [Halopseudomonas salina]
MHIVNDYSEAIPVERALYAVRLRDNGWSIADGPGTQIVLPEQVAQAGYHIPVRFDSCEAARQAILGGPETPFDIKPDSRWVTYCLSAGGVFCKEYEPASGPENSSSRSG